MVECLIIWKAKYPFTINKLLQTWANETFFDRPGFYFLETVEYQPHSTSKLRETLYSMFILFMT